MLLLATLLVFLPLPALAQGGLQAHVDRNELTVEESLRLALTVTGSQGARPRLPELPDFDIASAGQSSQIRIVNGRTTASIRYDYLLTPKHAGTFTIPPATVEIDGRSHTSQPITVQVLPASAAPRESKDVFLTAAVSTTEPWVGQQVIYTWRFYYRTQVGNARLEPFEFDGFVAEDLGEVQEYETTVNGQGYRVSELKKALFPQEAGKLTIPASVLHCQVVKRERGRGRGRSLFDDVFGRTTAEPRVLRTQPIELTVRPLPPAPAGFSGLVGEFELTADLSKRELAVGESATLNLTVSGTGNAQMIPEPRMPDLPAFKVYDEKPTGVLNRSGGVLAGRKSFSKALVPLQPGELTLPPVTLTWFDAEAGSYRTSRTPEIPLTVTPGEGKEDLRLTESLAPTTGKVAVRILADDILPLYKDLDAVTFASAGAVPAPVLAGGLAVPPLLFLGLWLLRRRQEQYAADSGLRRRRTALSRARKGLEELSAAAGAAAAAEAASRLLRRYVGDKLGCEGTALTPVEAGERLQEAGVDGETAARVRRLLERLEAAQYGAGGVEAGAIRGELEPLLGELEGRLR
jgi:hypothetical protein